MPINWSAVPYLAEALSVGDVEASQGPSSGDTALVVRETGSVYQFAFGSTAARDGTTTLTTNGQGPRGRWIRFGEFIGGISNNALPTNPALASQAPNLAWSVQGGTTLRLSSTTNNEILQLNALLGATVDLQTNRVNGVVVSDFTATGAVEVNAVAFVNGVGGGDGVVSETAGGSLQIAAGALSNGNIVINALAAGIIYHQFGGITKSYQDATSLTFKNAQTIQWETTGGAPQVIMRGTAGDETAIGALTATGGLSLFTAGFGTRVVQIGVGGTTLAFYGGTPVTKPNIAGVLSAVVDANAKAVLTSIIAALKTAAGGVSLVADTTT